MARPRRNDFIIPTLAVVFDCLAIEGAFLASYWLRFHTTLFANLPLTEDQPPLDAYVFGSYFVIPVWLLLFRGKSMYGARRNVPLSDEFLNIVKLVTFGMLVVMSAAFFYRAFSYSRVVFGLLWLTAIICLTFGRALLLEIERSLYIRGRELRNAVIIGSNATANRIFETLNNHPLLGYRLEGYFAETHVAGESALSAARHLGTIAEVPSKLVSEHIELVMMAMDAEDHEVISRVVNECEGVNVEFLMVPDILELMAGNFMVREIEGIPFLRIKGVPMTTWGRILKRSFDAAVAALLLLLFSPVLLLITLLIKLDSRGPVLFRQERIGLDGKNFDMLKFRSMKVEAESKSGPVFAKEDDPRRTAIGAFLRKTSLDEFPQLINVLRGEMSLVGPRPERPFFVDRFKDLVPKYLDRHRVKTGMTGWAQVNGLRGNTSIEERIKYDVYYIENWSLWFDVKILLKTVRALFPSKHAY